MKRNNFGLRIRIFSVKSFSGLNIFCKSNPSTIVALVMLLSGYGLFFQGCATPPKPAVGMVPEQKPRISKSLTEEAPKRFIKRKVALGRFTNETKYGQGFFRDQNQDPLGKQAMDILSAKLVATEKFILLERADSDKINSELMLKMAKDEILGNILDTKISADYIIVGSISEFGRKEVSDVGVFSRTKKQMAHAKVNLRLIDVYSGQVIYSEEGAGEAFAEVGTVMGLGARAGYDSSLNDKVISAAISKIVGNVIENLLDKPWRSYILSIEDKSKIIIAGGKSQGIRVNDVFGVYKKGKRVKNPQTNMFIELPGELLGKIKVQALMGSDPNNEYALCNLSSGGLPQEITEEFFVQELAESLN